MNKFKLSVYCFLFALAFTTTIHAGEARQIRAVFVQETGSSTPSECATAKASISGTSLRIFLSETDKWMGTPEFAVEPSSMTIRYFDGDGNYLGRFKTKDMFYPEWVMKSENLRLLEFYLDKSTFFGKDTEISYKINARDIAFIEIIELSFDSELAYKRSKQIMQK